MHHELSLLVLRRHLTPDQAAFIHANSYDSPGDLWSQPQVRAIGEHTRAYIDRLRGHLCSPVPFDEQEGVGLDG